MQLFEKMFSVCVISAVCHNPKGPFLQFWCAISFKAPVWEGINGSYIDFMPEMAKYRFSLFITPNVRDILLAILVCVSSNS